MPALTPLTEQSIRQLLLSSDQAVVRACMALHERQLVDEKACRQTKHKNGIGFNSADASFLSHVAVLGKRWEYSEIKCAHPAMLTEARKRLLKYSGQLLEIALAKQADSQLKTML